MMNYDFDKILPQQGTNKKIKPDKIRTWIASNLAPLHHDEMKAVPISCDRIFGRMTKYTHSRYHLTAFFIPL
jgi:hypothetical protein